MTESKIHEENKQNELEGVVAMKDMQYEIAKYTTRIQELEAEKSMAEHNELMLWRTIGPALLQQFNNNES